MATARVRRQPAAGFDRLAWEALSASLGLSLCGGAVVLLLRRLSGALNEPLPAIAMAGSAAGACIVAAYIRQVNDPIYREQARRRRFGDIAISLALVAIAFSLSLPAASIWGTAAMWLVVVSEEAWHWGFKRARENLGVRQSKSESVYIAGRPPNVNRFDLDQAAENEEWSDPAAAQRLWYHRTTDGSLIVEGWLRVPFNAEQRVAVVHIAFCPTFKSMPEVEAEPLDGPDCDARATLVLPWGVRWEVRLDRAAGADSQVVLGFRAVEATKL